MNPPRSGPEQALGTTPVKLANTIVDEYDIIDPLDQLVSYSIKLLVADTGRVLELLARRLAVEIATRRQLLRGQEALAIPILGHGHSKVRVYPVTTHCTSSVVPPKSF
jgi:hypothetical protein